MEAQQLFISVVKNNDDEKTLFMLYLSSLDWYSNFFFTYNLFKRFTFLLVKAENLNEGFSQGDCFGRDSCARSQDVGECVSNSVAEAMIMEINDMYHPASCF